MSIHVIGELMDSTNCSVWSKTTLFIGGVGETGVDPPNCKMGTFILLSLTIAEPSLINFQLNGVKMFREFFKNIRKHIVPIFKREDPPLLRPKPHTAYK